MRKVEHIRGHLWLVSWIILNREHTSHQYPKYNLYVYYFGRLISLICYLLLLYLTLYITYKIKVMFLQNWYPRETSLLFTGRQMLCSMPVQTCIRFCIPELQSWPEAKKTNMKFMKTQDKNTQINVYCIQHYCK